MLDESKNDQAQRIQEEHKKACCVEIGCASGTIAGSSISVALKTSLSTFFWSTIGGGCGGMALCGLAILCCTSSNVERSRINTSSTSQSSNRYSALVNQDAKQDREESQEIKSPSISQS